MDGVLISIKQYNSKTQTRYTGLVWKCVFKVENNGRLEDWSLQCFPRMRNYQHWRDMIDAKKAQPGKWIMMKNLKPYDSTTNRLEADYGVDEPKPDIIDIIDPPARRPKAPITPKKPIKQEVKTQFNDLFIWKGKDND